MFRGRERGLAWDKPGAGTLDSREFLCDSGEGGSNVFNVINR